MAARHYGPVDEAAALAAALAVLPPGDVRELAVQKGRRVVVRAGDLVVKAFSSLEQAAFERERAGLQALASGAPGLAVEPVASGERWVATRFVPGAEAPMRLAVDEVAIHRALGPWLARLHAVPPVGLAPWSVVDRLRARLGADLPAGCPPSLAADVRRMVEPLLGLVVEDGFVHGDWGTANVLVDPAAPTSILAVIDLEDAHRGDPAEDFAWPVLAGPRGVQAAAMAATYGRGLGPHAVERLVVAAAEKCLDVLGWRLDGAEGRRFHDRCRTTLAELVDGRWPEPPPFLSHPRGNLGL
jgi:Ser/Thr protein kinase RdoA (MazF antagonist)